MPKMPSLSHPGSLKKALELESERKRDCNSENVQATDGVASQLLCNSGHQSKRSSWSASVIEQPYMASHSTHSMATIPPSLLDLLQTILPIAIQQLADSHHVQRPPRTDLEVAFVNYAYSFANDPRWSSAFQPFRPFSGHLQSSAGNSEDDLNSGQDEDVDEDSDEEGAQTPLWSLATAQARAEAATSNGLGQEYSRARKGKACGHIFRKGESVYRCK